ncbi:cytochrome c family protein [Roseomonas nepalensis]|uniref:Cytochrome c family protein n=1 Tax=Muricoccus nepalensis TaxID=1854500 RepID=A0A502GA85_9PROT|nr:cytochrome c family protein [Roseomonas nepalensis]TPG58561.1 cytochrome c family protein [Roseomonas nepalensis]
MIRISVIAAPLLLGLVALPSGGAQAQDVAAGQRVFAQCRACHIADASDRNAVGPNLYGVVGRRAASRESYTRYSANMKQLGADGHVWTEENLHAYLANPKAVAPQGSMAFPGLRQEQQINDVIAYLKSVPTAAPAGAAPAAGAATPG